MLHALGDEAAEGFFAGEVERLNKARTAGRRRRILRAPRVAVKVNRAAERAIAKALRTHFVETAKHIARQVAPALGKARGARDPFGDPEIQATLDRLHSAEDAGDAEAVAAARRDLTDLTAERLQLADAGDWTVLIDPLASELEAVAGSAGLSSLEVVGLHNDRSIVQQVNRDAADFAGERAAELVGKRRNSEGGLEDNPDAAWAIDDATRELIAGDVTQAIEEGWSTGDLARHLTSESYGFSERRAETIARTEIIRANNAGNMAGYRASGVVQGKIWLAGNEGDGDACDDCEANADEGVIGLEEDFGSGDDAPPAHPNCRCAVAPVVDDDGEAEHRDEEDADNQGDE